MRVAGGDLSLDPVEQSSPGSPLEEAVQVLPGHVGLTLAEAGQSEPGFALVTWPMVFLADLGRKRAEPLQALLESLGGDGDLAAREQDGGSNHAEGDLCGEPVERLVDVLGGDVVKIGIVEVASRCGHVGVQDGLQRFGQRLLQPRLEVLSGFAGTSRLAQQ